MKLLLLLLAVCAAVSATPLGWKGSVKVYIEEAHVLTHNVTAPTSLVRHPAFDLRISGEPSSPCTVYANIKSHLVTRAISGLYVSGVRTVTCTHVPVKLVGNAARTVHDSMLCIELAECSK